MVVPTGSPAPVLQATDLVAGYVPGVNILNGCNLDVYPGELIGIIGPNGAGKSTLLKALFGLVSVRSGSVTLKGEDITGFKANRLVQAGVGFVPQNNNVFPSLTIEENLQMGLFQAPKRFAERFAFIVDLFPILGDRRKQRAGYTPYRHVVSFAYNNLSRLLFGVPTHDAGSQRLVRSRLLLDVPRESRSVYADAELLIRCQYLGYRVEVVDVEHQARSAGAGSGARWQNVIAATADMLRLWRKRGQLAHEGVAKR